MLNATRFLRTTALAGVLLSAVFFDSYASRVEEEMSSSSQTGEGEQKFESTLKRAREEEKGGESNLEEKRRKRARTSDLDTSFSKDAGEEAPYILSHLENPIALHERLPFDCSLFNFLPPVIMPHIARMSFTLGGSSDAIKSFLNLCIASPFWVGEESRTLAASLLL